MSIPLIDRDGKTIGHLPNSKLANVGIVVVEDVQLSGAEDGHEVPLHRHFRYNGAVQPRDVQFIETNTLHVAKSDLFDGTQEVVVASHNHAPSDLEQAAMDFVNEVINGGLTRADGVGDIKIITRQASWQRLRDKVKA